MKYILGLLLLSSCHASAFRMTFEIVTSRVEREPENQPIADAKKIPGIPVTLLKF